jgi:phosphoglycolate phosphatase-like HAD superfamily hydrolase
VSHLLRAIILDFDGVLVESEGLKTEIFRHVFARYPEHYNAMMAYHQQSIAASRFDKFAHLSQLLGRANDQTFLDSLAAEFSSLAIAQTVACPEVKGASNFLHEFSSRLPLCLASVTPESDLIEILQRRNWLSYFAKVFGYPPHSKAEAVSRAAESIQDRSALAIIGDSPNDLQVAIECGIEFIGRDSGIVFPDPRPSLYRDMNEIAAVVRTRLMP